MGLFFLTFCRCDVFGAVCVFARSFVCMFELSPVSFAFANIPVELELWFFQLELQMCSRVAPPHSWDGLTIFAQFAGVLRRRGREVVGCFGACLVSGIEQICLHLAHVQLFD